jgi:hypothetical protein
MARMRAGSRAAATPGVTAHPAERWRIMVTMPEDPEITDQALGSEIELLSDVITAASDSEQSLSDAEHDTVLGVDPPAV